MATITFSRKKVEGESVRVACLGFTFKEIINYTIALAQERKRNVKLGFNGTVVTIAPGSNPNEVLSNWYRTRGYQQK